MERVLSRTPAELQLAAAAEAELINFREFGDCRGPEYLETHPEARERAVRELAGRAALADAA